MNKINQYIFIIITSIASSLLCQNFDRQKFKNSKIIKIPDLSFTEKVYSGLDILEQMDFNLLQGKSIVLVTNQTAINRNGVHLLDILKSFSNIKIKAILELEHGLWGVDDKRSKLIGREQIEPTHGARIMDIFNKYEYPPSWVFKEVDYLLVDFQDTGSRYTTYIGTLTKIFESASKEKIEVIVLDRPNPIRGDIINGPIPRLEFQSLESYHLFPIRHGLTLGEMILIINELGWIKGGQKINLSIVPISNWDRNNWYDENNYIWKNPKPYINDLKTLLAYNGMDLFRGTNLNLGFGTKKPYLIIGAPWLETNFLLKKLNEKNLGGVTFERIKYRPKGSTNHYRVPLYDGLSCSGIEININDIDKYNPIYTATTLMLLIHQLHPRQFQWKDNGYIDKLFGSDVLRLIASQNKGIDQLSPHWNKDVSKFYEFRKPYLLY